jgi:hypothetical protein
MDLYGSWKPGKSKLRTFNLNHDGTVRGLQAVLDSVQLLAVAYGVQVQPHAACRTAQDRKHREHSTGSSCIVLPPRLVTRC